jgi:hypothetical protein
MSEPNPKKKLVQPAVGLDPRALAKLKTEVEKALKKPDLIQRKKTSSQPKGPVRL